MKNLDDETVKYNKPHDFDISLFGTPGMPNYESTTVLPLRNKFKSDKLLTTFNEQTCTVDVRKLLKEQQKLPLKELIDNEMNAVESTTKQKSSQPDFEKQLVKENDSSEIEYKKELSKENAHPKNVDNSFDESNFHKPVGFVSVPQSNKTNLTETKSKGHQLQLMSDLCDFGDMNSAGGLKGSSKTLDIDDMDFCIKKDSKNVDTDMNFMFSKSSQPSIDKVNNSVRSQREKMDSIDDILLSTNSKKRSSDTNFDEMNLFQKFKKQDTKKTIKDLTDDLIDDPFDSLPSCKTWKSSSNDNEDRTTKEVQGNVSVDKFKSIFLDDDCFKADKDDNFEMMFQRESKGE